MEKGNKLKCIFNTALPGNKNAPPLELAKEYEVKDLCTDSMGNIHVDVGIVSELNYVTSYATKEELPGNAHWCHPNRFVSA